MIIIRASILFSVFYQLVLLNFLQCSVIRIAGEESTPIDEFDFQVFEDLQSELFQGDIKLLPQQLEEAYTNTENTQIASRTGLRSEVYRWEKDRNGAVIVAYLIKGSEYCKLNSFSEIFIKIIQIFE